MLNKKWRPVELMELKKMPISRLETIISSSELSKKDADWIWPIERGAFEVF